jgi:hypothetical protein
MDPAEENQLLEKLTAFRKQPTIELNEGDVVEDEMVWVMRSIRRKRGSWYQMPKDLPDTDDEGAPSGRKGSQR